MPRRQTGTGKKSGEADGPVSLRGVRPWGEFAKPYFDAGWCPLPLPPRKKSSPPTGTTGKYEMPNKAKIANWHKTKDARGNIAIRVPEDVIGIDVDAYDGKAGRAGLEQLEEELGPLPPTWTLTSRKDGTSGIRFFRVPGGLHWPGEPVPDVQIVQNHHRYAVAYPSVHPDTGEIYLWYRPGDTLGNASTVTVEEEIPQITVLPKMPQAWVEGLTGGKVWRGLAADADATSKDIAEWIRARPAGEMCRLMRKEADRGVEEMSVGGAHDTLNARLYSLVSLATEGHAGVSRGLRKLRDAFYAEVTQAGRKGRRSGPSAAAEFNRARDGAIRIMMASVKDGESVLEEECGCTGSSLDWGDKLGIAVDEVNVGGKTRAKVGKAKAPDKYTYDDSGNADHLLDILDNSACYLPELKFWTFWDAELGHWYVDRFDSRIREAAQLIGKRCRELADEYTDRLVKQGSSLTQDVGGDVATRAKQLYAHANASSNLAKLKSMAELAASQRRAIRSAAEFDTRPELIACPNGTLELTEDGVVFGPAERADRLSLSTLTPFDWDATSPAWDAYLNKFLPDRELRTYVQTIAGYTLYGSNPERLMFFMQGKTSTGKTTFINALAGAFGDYAGTMNLSLFRDNQDEKPRPDIIDALPKRLLAASESSAEWRLHGDQVKRLTGGDPLKARALHGNLYVERKPSFTPWIATNAMPQMHGIDTALKRRLRQVPFVHAVPEGKEDLRVSRALSSSEGRSAVLAWAVRGWELYQEVGELVEPDAVQVATARMFAELSEIDMFLHERFVAEEGACVPVSDLWREFSMWCEDQNWEEGMKMSQTKFGRELNGRGHEAGNTRISGTKGVTRVRFGLRNP